MPRRIASGSEQLEDLPGTRVAIEPGLLEDRSAVLRDLESTAAGRNHPDLRVGIFPPDLGRQTDGPRFVVSQLAIFDRDRHGVGSW
jgi:hypothetical protein